MDEVTELLDRLVAADREYRAAIKAAQARGGKLVLDARKNTLKLTQRQLAEKIGVHHTYLSKVENGQQIASRRLLRHIAQLVTGEEIEDRHTRYTARPAQLAV